MKSFRSSERATFLYLSDLKEVLKLFTVHLFDKSIEYISGLFSVDLNLKIVNG
jgi:hypothetical protein